MAKSALRVLEIMEYIAKREDGATHAEIARGLGIPKSSLTALLADLQSAGYVVGDPATARYALGSQVLVLAQGYVRTLNLVRSGSRVLETLFRRFDEFVALAIPKGDEYVIVAAQAPAGPLAHSLQIGERGPLYCSASGKAILASLPEAAAEAWVSRMQRSRITPRTRTGVAEIMDDLRAARAAGHAVVREEAILGITAIAAAVIDASGQPVGALSLAAPTARLDAAREAEVAAALRDAAAAISAEFGWRRKVLVST